MIGERFNRLVVTGYAGSLAGKNGKRRKFWECLCDCGATKEVATSCLRGGRVRSGGCLQRESRSSSGVRNATHRQRGGHYKRWQSMRERCNNPNADSYPRYGGRGISVAPEWDKAGGYEPFLSFLETLGPKPEGHTLDRIDNDGNYEPGNLRWASGKEQQANRA